MKENNQQELQHKSARILIVDDEAFNRQFLQRHLLREGFTLIQMAETGQHAIDLLRENAFE